MDSTRRALRRILTEAGGDQYSPVTLAEALATHAWDLDHETVKQVLFAPPEQIEDELYDQHQWLLRELFPEYVVSSTWGSGHDPLQDLVHDDYHYGGEEEHAALAQFLKSNPGVLAAHHSRIVDEHFDEYGMSTQQMKAARSVPDEQAGKPMPLGLRVLQKLEAEQEPDEDDFAAGGDPFETAKDRFGVTGSFSDAFYLLPDGEMISGAGGSGSRAFDHRQIGYGEGGTRGMQEFMGLGAIRLMPEDGGLDIMVEPTSAQYRTLEGWIDNFSPEGMPLDMQDGLGEFDERNDYYLKSARNKSYMFDPGENPRRIMGAIRRFYAGQDESLTECRHVIRRLLTERVEVVRHAIEDEATAEFYFGIGHGDPDYVERPTVTGYEGKTEYTDPMTHEIWILIEGQIERYPQLDMDRIREEAEDEGFDLNDPEQLRAYMDDQISEVGELATVSHNQVWSYLNPDEHWKGHYEGDTERLSVVNPGRYRWTGQLQGLLQAEFNPKEIHLFE